MFSSQRKSIFEDGNGNQKRYYCNGWGLSGDRSILNSKSTHYFYFKMHFFSKVSLSKNQPIFMDFSDKSHHGRSHAIPFGTCLRSFATLSEISRSFFCDNFVMNSFFAHFLVIKIRAFNISLLGENGVTNSRSCPLECKTLEALCHLRGKNKVLIK